MVVCLSVKHGLFARINRRNPIGDSIPIDQARHTAFLSEDSFVECDELIELDETQVAISLAANGIRGAVHRSLAVDIVAALERHGRIRPADLRRIRGALGL